ncbi:MAG: NUDIX hydrolase [Deltaproteobacteria bacterium]|nr:NUDIX hydrolase [Deltaproteobacteria bacterium]MCZ6626228.1 NUDIX hydrolase [Deltaproteobacteria bacterium]
MSSSKDHDHAPVEYRFCPCCGGELERRKIKANEPARLVCQKCSFIFYIDPKVVAGTIFSIDDHVVLLRRGVEPAIGKWVFPGGYVDRGESVRDAAIRETKEESNLDVRLRSLINVYSYPHSPNVIVVYAAEIVGGELSAADESLEAQTFGASQIPWEELAFPSTKDALRDYVNLYLHSKS